MCGQDATAAETLARIAHDQHGVVTRVQLLDAGLTPRQIDWRQRTGALVRVHRGVYRVGHRAPNVEARYMAAVLACGKGALLSGKAAGHVYGIVKRRAPHPEVTVPTKRKVEGIATRQARVLHSDATTWRGIPITSVPRTVVDLAAGLSTTDLARACHEAGVRHATTPHQVEASLSRCRNAPGSKKLREVLRGDARVTLSRLEERFLARLREAGLELPETNRPAGGRRVDCRWPRRGLTVELDSYRYHGSRHAWEQDRRREREAHARGDEFRRYTYGDVLESPGLMLAELRRLLRPR